MPNETPKPELNITVADIYKVLCPKCKEELLTLVASRLATTSIKEQLKKDWENKK